MEQLTKVRDHSSNRENRVGGTERRDGGREREAGGGVCKRRRRFPYCDRSSSFKIGNCRCCTVKSDYTGQPRRVNECCIVRLQVGLKKSEFPKV